MVTPQSLPRLDHPIMAGCQEDTVSRVHGRHVGDAILVAQRGSSVQPTVNVPPLLDKCASPLA